MTKKRPRSHQPLMPGMPEDARAASRPWPQQAGTIPTEDIIRAVAEKFIAPRGEKFISVGGRNMPVHTAGEKVLHLPNGAVVRVTTDDSGHATQVEEDDKLHAIARPDPIVFKIRRGQ